METRCIMFVSLPLSLIALAHVLGGTNGRSSVLISPSRVTPLYSQTTNARIQQALGGGLSLRLRRRKTALQRQVQLRRPPQELPRVYHQAPWAMRLSAASLVRCGYK